MKVKTAELVGAALDGDLLAVQALIDRLEAAEADAMEQARLNGMGSEREAALMAKLEVAERKAEMLHRLLEEKRKDHAVTQEQNSTLRDKIEQMERQKAVVEVQWAAGLPGGILELVALGDYFPKLGDKLYTLPGAQGELKS